ncbi:MAG: DUF104 domain-containing protein [Methanomicrobiales archaeon]|nr:DUF104 domain-containing protein [Methanomicrobiales archaeon]
MVKAIFRDNMFIVQEKMDLFEGEVVEIEIRKESIVDKFCGSFHITDVHLIEEIAESDEFE